MDKETINSFYFSGVEKTRLLPGHSELEGIRTKEIVSRYLPDNLIKIIDVGGATGFYSFWLKSLGHHVTLVDLSQDHISWAKEYSLQNQISLDAYEVGDATSLQFEDNQFDMALLLGPLYHLIDRTDRINAISEAKRVLRPNGIIISAVISRYASLIDGLHRNLIADPQFVKILNKDLENAIHINPTDNPEYFTTSYFHTPDEIESEILECDLQLEKLIAVESLGWLSDFSSANERNTNLVLDLLRRVETNRDLLASSPHILAIARKQ